jgi:ArsR family transcriptional regulator, arsenate/arsenite/antimonite-responsive transcriptional repressor
VKDCFAALAHPTRREILRLLRDGPLSAGELAERFELAKPTLSGHFNVLKAADLISAERRGTTLLYRLNLSVMEEAIAALMELAGSRRRRRGGESRGGA